MLISLAVSRTSLTFTDRQTHIVIEPHSHWVGRVLNNPFITDWLKTDLSLHERKKEINEWMNEWMYEISFLSISRHSCVCIVTTVARRTQTIRSLRLAADIKASNWVGNDISTPSWFRRLYCMHDVATVCDLWDVLTYDPWPWPSTAARRPIGRLSGVASLAAWPPVSRRLDNTGYRGVAHRKLIDRSRMHTVTTSCRADGRIGDISSLYTTRYGVSILKVCK